MHREAAAAWRKLTGALLAAGAALVPIHFASAQSGSCPVAGRYAVVGQVPGVAGSYRGEAIISANATGCAMRWFPPNDSFGTGSYSNGVLTIYFTFANGGSGEVRYTRAANGEMHGVWWMNGNPANQGRETLHPL